jgi:hypothetical protein
LLGDTLSGQASNFANRSSFLRRHALAPSLGRTAPHLDGWWPYGCFGGQPSPSNSEEIGLRGFARLPPSKGVQLTNTYTELFTKYSTRIATEDNLGDIVQPYEPEVEVFIEELLFDFRPVFFEFKFRQSSRKSVLAIDHVSLDVIAFLLSGLDGDPLRHPFGKTVGIRHPAFLQPITDVGEDFTESLQPDSVDNKRTQSGRLYSIGRSSTERRPAR